MYRGGLFVQRQSPSVCNPWMPAVFANPESWDWPRLNPGIKRLQKFVKNILFLSIKYTDNKPFNE